MPTQAQVSTATRIGPGASVVAPPLVNWAGDDGVAGAGRAAAIRRWARRAALAVGGFLLPWCVLLAMTLPRTVQAQHWSLAWVGLDAAEAVAALATALLLARADPRASLTAVAGGVLLTIDAWFDVCTSAPGPDQVLALAEAVFVELPLASAAFWLALALTRTAGGAHYPPPRGLSANPAAGGHAGRPAGRTGPPARV